MAIDKESCTHKWDIKYSRFNGYEGVEWFCTKQCSTSLAWPTAKNRVNGYPALLSAVLDTITRIEWFLDDPADRELDAALATLRLALEKANESE